MKKIILDVINRTAIGEVSEGDSGDVLELKSDTLPSEWDNCSIFALFTQDKQSKHIRIGNDLSVAIPPEFTDTNKAFQIGVYAVGGNMTRDVRPSVWIRVENTEFTTEDLVVTEQSIDDILALQSLSASIDVAEKDRIIAENKREEAEAKRVEAESQRQTDISTIKENISALQEEMPQKVDKIDGMGLSQNSYTDHDADKLAGIEYGAQVNEPVDQTYNSQSRNAQSGKAVSEAISNKVDKEEGYDLLSLTLVGIADFHENKTVGFGLTSKDSVTVQTYDIEYLDTLFGKKVNKSELENYATNDFVNELINDKADKDYVDSAISELGFEIDDVYGQYIVHDGQIRDLSERVFQTPVAIIPETLSPNTSYNFGVVESLSTAFPSVANDGDVIYLTFMTEEASPNITIDFTYASDLDIEIEPNTGYEIYAKYNGSIWIVGYSEYVVSDGDTI